MITRRNFTLGVVASFLPVLKLVTLKYGAFESYPARFNDTEAYVFMDDHWIEMPPGEVLMGVRPLTEAEQDIVDFTEKSKGRKLTAQEINLSLDQARAIGEL